MARFLTVTNLTCTKKEKSTNLRNEFNLFSTKYRMVFASTCEHASSAFILGSTSSDLICFANSEHFRKFRWRAASTS